MTRKISDGEEKNRFSLLTLISLVVVVNSLAIFYGAIRLDYGEAVGLYGGIHLKNVSGRLIAVTLPEPLGNIASTNAGSFLARVKIRQDDDSIISFSTNNQQWALYAGDKVKGKCAAAVIFPYAPWHPSKGGAYHGGYFLSVKDCK